MANRFRNERIEIKLTKEEKEVFEKKMKLANCKTMSHSNTIEILKIIFMKVPKTALILCSILLRRDSPTSFDLNRIFPL